MENATHLSGRIPVSSNGNLDLWSLQLWYWDYEYNWRVHFASSRQRDGIEILWICCKVPCNFRHCQYPIVVPHPFKLLQYLFLFHWCLSYCYSHLANAKHYLAVKSSANSAKFLQKFANKLSKHPSPNVYWNFFNFQKLHFNIFSNSVIFINFR